MRNRIMPNDTVKHRPSGEIWAVCGVNHESGSLARRCPTWEEMCMIKDIFWGEEECVVEYHPPRSQYVNRHPYCLHLWKKIGEEFETPPKEYVG